MESQIKILEKIAKSGKIPHAFLFEGPEGTGKKETAISFAKLLLKSEIKNHPDFLLIQPKKDTISIDQIREELIRFLSLTPFLGDKKVAIIEKAELMNKEAQNALLKTLEEPKGNSVLILISSKPELLLPTILSRCQKISFSKRKNNEEFSKENSEKEELIEKILKNDIYHRLKLLEKVKDEDEFLKILVKIFRKKLLKENEKEKAKRVLKLILNLEMTNYLTKTNKRSLLEFLILQI